MGLDARVCCNCIKEGLASPHPSPLLLTFDETGEPTLKSEAEISLDQWLEHDKWHRNSCPHAGYRVSKRLGNAALAGQVRDFVDRNLPTSVPILRTRVVYSGTHCCDWIAAQDAQLLLDEVRKLQDRTKDPLIVQFTDDLIELAEASIATKNPIVF
jgi:hypothetical protein